MQELALVLARLDQVLLARELIDDSDPDPGFADPVAQLRGEVPLNLFAREPAHSSQERSDMDLGAAVGDEGPLGRHRVARISLANDHLIGALIGARTGHGKRLADRPEAEQPDAELPLDPGGAALLETALDRVANMCGDIAEIRPPIRVARHPDSVIADAQILLSALPAAGNRHRARLGVDAVLD
jgi:hypothetical protein